MNLESYTAEINGAKIKYASQFGAEHFVEIEVGRQQMRLSIDQAEALFHAVKMLCSLKK